MREIRSEHTGRSPADARVHHLVFHTRDADEAARLLADSAVPYRSELLSPVSTFSTRIVGSESPRMHLSRVSTTGTMHVEALLPEGFYAVVLGLSGNLEHRVNGEIVPVGSSHALVQSPLQPVEVRTPERFDVLFAKLRRGELIHELEKRLLRPAQAPLLFSPRLELTTEAGRRFRRLLLTLSAQYGLDRKTTEPDSGLWGKKVEHGSLPVRAVEDQLVTLLLEAHRHNYTRLLARYQDAGPWYVRAAEDYMCANTGRALSLGDICIAAGVNSRTLQHTFQRRRGCTPMQFLRALRLERVREDLSQPDEPTTVTDVASRWGFFHFGRFAAQYHMRFGEKPSETLRRARV